MAGNGNSIHPWPSSRPLSTSADRATPEPAATSANAPKAESTATEQLALGRSLRGSAPTERVELDSTGTTDVTEQLQALLDRGVQISPGVYRIDGTIRLRLKDAS